MDELPKNHDRYWVPGLARGLDILNAIADAQKPLSLPEIGKLLGLPRPSIFRLAYTLEHLGYIEAVPGTRGYDLSSRVLRLGYAYLAGRDVVDVARPILDQLAQETGLSAHLGALSQSDTVYLLHAPGKAAYVSTIGAGDRLPAYATPLGLAILAGKTDVELRELFKDRKLVKMTGQTPDTIKAILSAVAEVRANGFATSHGAVHAGGQSVAAPLRSADGEIRAAVGVSGPDSAISPGELEARLCPLVLDAAASISHRLGYRADNVTPAPQS